VVPRATGSAATRVGAPAPESRSATSIDGQFIICVDNEQDILDGMQGLLTKWGARPLVARRQQTALQELERLRRENGQAPALLLVDYHLDDKVTGLEVIAALRAEAGCYLSAAILTADHSTEVSERVRAAGHALLHKPVKPAALRALINRILSRQIVD
jgi:DNA-binding response OmpR family regulator